MKKFIYISLPYMTFALLSNNGIIVKGPPISKWTLNKNEEFVIDYYKKKGAYIEEKII